MKRFNIKKIVVTVLLGFLSCVTPLLAQTGKVTLGKVKFDNLPSPQFNAGKNKNFKPKDWLEVEIKFNVEMPRSYKQAFIDRVTVKWYVAVDDPKGARKPVLLEKEISYVNIPVGEDVYTSIYLSPAAIKRITGKSRASRSTVKSVGGEILVNGQAAYKGSGKFSSSRSKSEWWNKLSRYDSIQLLNKNETPFKFLWWDRYGEIEQKRR